ncbi:SDR family oxidoreductase [Niveispirillum sp. BGYR6]|uniref:SDR family NAD(P)-dependent oxidoreductase n=1 Tax=Niveispirillum sp. BGYR6 TaxID=2971249 RepID=UPI0022B95A2B|nr:SDR family oxidoreductase [Niveispirillum sp. BGYR6]MDG5495884.1 SDR family oxidoreductase [Niveispirillum sp. BGYR6]
MGRLQDRVALITGAGNPVGRAVAQAFAEEGAHLVLQYEDVSQRPVTNELVRQIERSGRRAVALMTEISGPNGAYMLTEAAVAGLGRVDILVNNAGMRPAIPVVDTTAEQFDLVMAANVRSAFMMTRMVLPLMFHQDYGRIITTVSDIAYHGAPGYSLYGAAAGALLGFTRSLVHDIGARNVTANCVAPGAIDPKLSSDTLRASLEAVRRTLPSQRLGELADIVPSYVFLASDEARHMVGQCLSPSGGAVML